MAVTDYRVRYGTTWYEHRDGDEAFPLPFRRAVETAAGSEVRWGNGARVIVDPDDPDSSFHLLVDRLNKGKWPDQIGLLVDDHEPSDIVY